MLRSWGGCSIWSCSPVLARPGLPGAPPTTQGPLGLVEHLMNESVGPARGLGQRADVGALLVLRLQIGCQLADIDAPVMRFAWAGFLTCASGASGRSRRVYVAGVDQFAAGYRDGSTTRGDRSGE